MAIKANGGSTRRHGRREPAPRFAITHGFIGARQEHAEAPLYDIRDHVHASNTSDSGSGRYWSPTALDRTGSSDSAEYIPKPMCGARMRRRRDEILVGCIAGPGGTGSNPYP